MEHKYNIDGYDSLEKLAEDIGDLRYDSLVELFNLLSEKFRKDAIADAGRNRMQLSNSLNSIADGFTDLSGMMDKTWLICKKYM